MELALLSRLKIVLYGMMRHVVPYLQYPESSFPLSEGDLGIQDFGF
ncbi:MAG: hypothetical protein ABJG88_02460 [Litorimonas sp.]